MRHKSRVQPSVTARPTKIEECDLPNQMQVIVEVISVLVLIASVSILAYALLSYAISKQPRIPFHRDSDQHISESD